MTTEISRAEASRLRKVKDRAFRKHLLSQFNCLCCNESDSDLIDWHHVNPDNKELKISSLNANHDKWWDEVLKCIPVCVLCHRKIHTNKLCLLPQKL
jgi:hypothetical protein